jgi:hypothetical protein
LACANGTIRTPHPIELFGHDWLEWFERRREAEAVTQDAAATGSSLDVGSQ